MRKTGWITACIAVLALALPLLPAAAAAPVAVKPLVCLDPGHGGSDSGAAANGLQEKEINLDVALRARPLIEALGYRVIMTRETDVYVSLADRCTIANNAGATIFVSVHNNAYTSTSQGTETFCYYSSHEGARLATFIQEELVKRLARPNRGVKEAGFYVLKNTNMTAALLEGAFLTNPDDANLLRTDDFRAKMAAGAAEGVRRYLADAWTNKFVFAGRGRGHGVGLCMDGVLYRAKDGQSYHDIMSYYYTGVQFGKADDNQPIRVKCRDGQIRVYSMKEYLYRLEEEPETYPSEGLKVLYIAARTYALSCIARKKHNASGFDVCSSGGCCQAFDENKDLSAYPNNRAAVDATSGEVCTYEGQVITAAYHGSCGGHTENIEDVWGGTPLPYLRGKPCGYCQRSSRYSWTVEMTRSELEDKLNSAADTRVGSLVSMDLSSRTPGGRVRQAVIVGSSGTKTVSGATLASRLGFSSSLFDLATAGPPPAYLSTFYFAEGYTGKNFQEYLCISNPNPAAATAEVTYMFSSGSPKNVSYSVPANSRYTVDVNRQVGADREVSVRLRSKTANIIAERPIYFSYQGKLTGGHVAVGSPSTAKKWYFAEGTTRKGFEEYVTVQNPGPKKANLTFRYMMEGKPQVKCHEQVGAYSRATFNVVNHVGPEKDVSLFLEADQDVVAERPVYFTYDGLALHKWTGGHVVVGTNSPAKTWYFAEGTTRNGFEEWLCLQNPNSRPITVNARYWFGQGQGGPASSAYTIPARQRLTVSVNKEIGAGKDVSVRLTSPADFICERPMYFNYSGNARHSWDGGHDVLGAGDAAKTWYFAEGCTGANFEEWLCFQNPGTRTATVNISYYRESGYPVRKTHKVQARSRYTVCVNRDAGANLQVSARIQADQPIVCERPMYFAFNGAWTGGHDVVGFVPIAP